MWRRSPRMDSNSTLVPNPHSSSWKRERCCVKGDHFAMAAYNDNHSESDHCIAYPAFPRPRLRIDSRIAAYPKEGKEQRPVSSTMQAINDDSRLFQDTLLESAGKSRSRNAWAAVGSLAFQLVLLVALVVIPL